MRHPIRPESGNSAFFSQSLPSERIVAFVTFVDCGQTDEIRNALVRHTDSVCPTRDADRLSSVCGWHADCRSRERTQESRSVSDSKKGPQEAAGAVGVPVPSADLPENDLTLLVQDERGRDAPGTERLGVL